MYKGLKKRYSREEYVKLTLIANEEKCYFCLHNPNNYQQNREDNMYLVGINYHLNLCNKCVHYRKNPLYWHQDYFETLYDWEGNK